MQTTQKYWFPHSLRRSCLRPSDQLHFGRPSNQLDHLSKIPKRSYKNIQKTDAYGVAFHRLSTLQRKTTQRLKHPICRLVFLPPKWLSLSPEDTQNGLARVRRPGTDDYKDFTFDAVYDETTKQNDFYEKLSKRKSGQGLAFVWGVGVVRVETAIAIGNLRDV